MSQPNILIVDDSSIIRRALSKQLEKTGAKVSQAEDGEQGIEEIESLGIAEGCMIWERSVCRALSC